MLGNKQTQSVAEGAMAIQAAGDVNFHQGLGVADVRELCILFLRENFPKLQEEAKKIAEKNIHEFAEKLEKRLVNIANSIEISRLIDPDVQATINDAVQACARKGIAANPDLLTSIISERISNKENNYKDTVLSESIKVIPILDADQIAFLTLVFFMKSVDFNTTRFEFLEALGERSAQYINGGFGLSRSKRQHLEYAGVLVHNPTIGGSVVHRHCDIYAKKFNMESVAEFQNHLAEKSPSYFDILIRFDRENLLGYSLTSVGEAIAIASMGQFITPIDYETWLS